MNALFQKIERLTQISCATFITLAIVFISLYEPELNQSGKTSYHTLIMLIVSMVIVAMFLFFVEKIKKEIKVYVDENDKTNNKRVEVVESF